MPGTVRCVSDCVWHFSLVDRAFVSGFAMRGPCISLVWRGLGRCSKR
jgi:hypothetical protein